jgi:hypothetical protein
LAGSDRLVFAVSQRQNVESVTSDALDTIGTIARIGPLQRGLSDLQQLHAGKPALQLSNAGDGSNGIERVGGDALDILPLRDREDQPVGSRQRRLDGAQSGRTAGANRRGDPREEDDLPQRKNGQSQSFGH